MRAVNLLPNDLRRAGSGGGSATGAGAYVLLGVLGLLVIVVATWAVSTRQVNERRAEVTRLNAEAQAAEAQAAGLETYRQTAVVATQRSAVVTKLVKGRFDWSGALRQVSQTIPDDAWITSMGASTSPAVNVEGASNPLRSNEQTPAIVVVGCTPSQADVARLMSRLRAMSGVTKVSLATSEKAAASEGGAAGASDGDCRAGSSKIPQFNLVVFYAAPNGATTAAPAAVGNAGAAVASANGTDAATPPASTGDTK
jgi:Tfp pilus assembly protein PilN